MNPGPSFHPQLVLDLLPSTLSMISTRYPKDLQDWSLWVILNYCGLILVPGGKLSKWIITADLCSISFTG